MKTWPDGARFDGQWKDDTHQGHGTWRQPDGAEYVGEWSSGKRHGTGTLRFPDGNVFEGQFKAAEMDGIGTFLWASGDADVGTYRADEPTGVGVRWSADRQTAWQLLNGQQEEAKISLDEARALAAKIGVPVPAPSAPAAHES